MKLIFAYFAALGVIAYISFKYEEYRTGKKYDMYAEFYNAYMRGFIIINLVYYFAMYRPYLISTFLYYFPNFPSLP